MFLTFSPLSLPRLGRVGVGVPWRPRRGAWACGGRGGRGPRHALRGRGRKHLLPRPQAPLRPQHLRPRERSEPGQGTYASAMGFSVYNIYMYLFAVF